MQKKSKQVSHLAPLLSEGIDELGLEIDADKQAILLGYLDQLVKWNQTYNLSGIREPEKMLQLHLLDSLSILPYVTGKVILDVGTGAGLPGFPLAICMPDSRFYLLDSNGKKTRFLFQACVNLDIRNIEVVQERVENYQCPEPVDVILGRAFSSLEQFVNRTRHLLGEQSKLLAMKGLYPSDEIGELPGDVILKNYYELSLPGAEGERHLLEIRKR